MRVPAPLLRVPAVRRGLRQLRRLVSVSAYRVRASLDGELLPRVTTVPRRDVERVVIDPAIQIVATTQEANGQETSEPLSEVALDLSGQTETSWTLDPDPQPPPPFVFLASEPLTGFPAIHLEALLMVMSAEPLAYAVSGWSSLVATNSAPPITQSPSGEPTTGTLLARLPVEGAIVGRVLPQITADDGERDRWVPEGARRVGSYLLREDQPSATLLSSPLQPVHRALQALPIIEGPPTVLFVLPYLAVGGAERLLLQLIEGLRRSHRCLVATLEPHAADGGQTLDEARELTPHVYTLGDWLPREARMSALRHLIRRYRVTTLFGWNGATDFYDQLFDLRREYPSLRIVNQLFNHQGGWIEHYSQQVLAAIDQHIAINSRIAATLRQRWRIPSAAISEIHHAIELPPETSPEEQRSRRLERREELGIPAEALVVGSFVRLHPQKRPLDILEIARRLEGRSVHFLLAGGGPLDGAIDGELSRSPLSNVTRLGLQSDPTPLFDALDLCLLTSEYEGLPLFLLEGLARGLPCIAPAVGDVPDLLDSGGGLVIDSPGDIPAFADAILELAPADRRDTEGRIGRERVRQDYSLERYVEEYRRAIFPEEAE